MPGHIKKNEGPDPDPSPWLVVTPELKSKLKDKPYDAKKSCWVPDKASGGYLEGLIESTEGDKTTVTILASKEVKLSIFAVLIDLLCFICKIYMYVLSILEMLIAIYNGNCLYD